LNSVNSTEKWTRPQWTERGALTSAAALLASPCASAETQVIVPGEDAGTRVYSVRAFRAKGDGVALDTAAVQAAIDRCTAEGSGTALVPECRFLIGTVELKNNVTLHLVSAVVLLGSGRERTITPLMPFR
jgi:polygalacturonase